MRGGGAGGAGGAPSCGRRGSAAPWDASAERGNAAPSSHGTRRQRGVVAPRASRAPPPPPRPGLGPPTRRGTNPGIAGGGAGRAGNGAPGPAPPGRSLPAPRGSSGGGGRAPPHLPRFILDGGVSSGSLFARPPRPAFLRAAGRGGGGRGDTRRDAAGPPPRRASPGSDGSERRCTPHRQPRARSGDTRGAPALRTLQRARMRTRDARRRGRCGVRVGSAATHRPNAPRRGAGPADPRRCGHGPLKLARLPAPRFYGPICLRRALPSPVNHSTRGGGVGAVSPGPAEGTAGPRAAVRAARCRGPSPGDGVWSPELRDTRAAPEGGTGRPRLSPPCGHGEGLSAPGPGQAGGRRLGQR